MPSSGWATNVRSVRACVDGDTRPTTSIATTPPASDEVDTATGAATTIDNALVAVSPPEATPTVNDDVPAVVGVPVIAPSDDRLNPAGNVVTHDQL